MLWSGRASPTSRRGTRRSPPQPRRRPRKRPAWRRRWDAGPLGAVGDALPGDRVGLLGGVGGIPPDPATLGTARPMLTTAWPAVRSALAERFGDVEVLLDILRAADGRHTVADCAE